MLKRLAPSRENIFILAGSSYQLKCVVEESTCSPCSQAHFHLQWSHFM
jgi:hypothetical protein